MDSAFIALTIEQITPALNRSARREAQSVAARGLALNMLKQHHDYADDMLSLEKTTTGKPVLAMPYAFDFSLAHSGPWVGCAMPKYPLISHLSLGLDIEQFMHHDWQAYGELDVFHATELQWIMSSQHEERDRRALICWCRKEAMLKALGYGLNLPLNQIGFDEQGTLVSLPERMGPASRWVVHHGEIQSTENHIHQLSREPADNDQKRAIYAIAWQSN